MGKLFTDIQIFFRGLPENYIRCEMECLGAVWLKKRINDQKKRDEYFEVLVDCMK